MKIDNDDDDNEDDEESGVPTIHLQVALVPAQVNVITKAVFASPSFVTFPCLRLFSYLFCSGWQDRVAYVAANQTVVRPASLMMQLPQTFRTVKPPAHHVARQSFARKTRSISPLLGWNYLETSAIRAAIRGQFKAIRN